MKRDNTTAGNSGVAFRYGMLVPLALMIASVISCSFSYSTAKQNIAEDLNDAMLALANENSELWTRPDTITVMSPKRNTKETVRFKLKKQYT